MFLADNLNNSFVFWFQSQVAEKGRELKELKDSLFSLTKEKEKLERVRAFVFIFRRSLPI